MLNNPLGVKMNSESMKKKRKYKYKKSIISRISGLFPWSTKKLFSSSNKNTTLCIDYPWTCSLIELSKIKLFKVDEMCIRCTFTNNYDHINDVGNNYTHQIMLEIIQSDFKFKLQNWFSDENVFVSDSKSSVYRFLQWLKDDKLKQISLDYIMGIMKKPYSIRITKREFSVEGPKIKHNYIVEDMLYKLKKVYTMNKQWKHYCTIFTNRIYEPFSTQINNDARVGANMDHSDIDLLTPHYIVKLSLDISNLYSMSLQHMNEFDEDIYAVSDFSFIRHF
jgi:hypothetical protein